MFIGFAKLRNGFYKLLYLQIVVPPVEFRIIYDPIPFAEEVATHIAYPLLGTAALQVLQITKRPTLPPVI